jgi:TIR domain
MERFIPRVFISYSWDSDDHKAWVKALAARLRSDGVDVTLDDWHVRPATKLPHFMENGVRDSDFVLVVCTAGYRKKGDARKGGVGYEDGIITGEIFEFGNHEKFIPLLRSGEWPDARPSWLTGAMYLDFRGSPYRESAYTTLLDSLFGLLQEAPPLGSRTAAWDLDLQYSNHDLGVLVRVCNRVEKPIVCCLSLQALDKWVGTPRNLQRVNSLSIPLAIGERVPPSGCAPWTPLVLSAKTDQNELKVESKDPRVPSIFLSEGGVWRVRMTVAVETLQTEVYSVWLAWTPGKSPKASDDLVAT